jgi:hypothetical protein
MRRRTSDAGIRRELADHGRQLLDLAEGVGDKRAAAGFRAHIAALEAGRSVKVHASDVGLPGDVGMVVLEADGSVTRLDDPTSAGQR